jgi:hypothetical protein
MSENVIGPTSAVWVTDGFGATGSAMLRMYDLAGRKRRLICRCQPLYMGVFVPR